MDLNYLIYTLSAISREHHKDNMSLKLGPDYNPSYYTKSINSSMTPK